MLTWRNSIWFILGFDANTIDTSVDKVREIRDRIMHYCWGAAVLLNASSDIPFRAHDIAIRNCMNQNTSTSFRRPTFEVIDFRSYAIYDDVYDPVGLAQWNVKFSL